MGTGVRSNSARWLWVALFVTVTLALLGGGYAYYHSETERIRQAKYQEIAAIGELKAGQIQEWRQERLKDLWRSAKAPFFKKALQEWLKDRNKTALQAELQHRLAVEQKEQRYSDVLLLDIEGNILLSADPRPHPLTPAAKQVVDEALAKRTALLSDLYRCPHGIVHLDAVAPILDQEGQPMAVLVLRSNAESYLYPLIQSWPTPSRTAETLLVLKDGDDVLFVNNLRHRPDSALYLREPLTLKTMPAVQAVLGKQGTFRGKDYRGVEVLADLRAVLQSPWFMVAKVDASEIMAEARYRGGVIALFSVLFILLAAGATAHGYRYRQVRIYRDLYRSERERRAAQEEFRTILYSIGDAVITTDTQGTVRQMNQVAERLTGWVEAEAGGKPLDHVFHIVNEDSGNEVENPVQRVLREGTVVGLANHTLLISKEGSEWPISDSGAPIRDESGAINGVVLVFRDQTEERQAQRAIRESENRYRSLFGNMLEGYAYCKMFYEDGEPRDFVYLAVNEAFETLTGLKNVIGKRVTEVIPGVKESNPEFFEVYGRVALTGNPERLETYVEPLGIWFSVSVYSTEREHFVAVFDNITARKRGEEKLRQAELRYRRLFEDAPIMYVITRNEQGVPFISHCNELFMRTVGYSREEVVGRPLGDFYSPESLAQLLEGGGYARALAGGFSMGERELLTRDGRLIPTLLYTATEVDPAGKVIGTRAMFVDITERREAESALRFEREQLLSIFESINEVILAIDPQTYEILYANKFTEALYGQALVGGNCYEKLNGFGSPCEHCLNEKVVDLRGKPYQWEYHSPVLKRDFLATDRMIRWPDGRDVKLQLAIDITERNRAEQEREHLSSQLLQAQKMEAVGILAGGVAHDFNNLLQVVLGYSELILDDEQLPGLYRGDLEKINQAARNGADLVQRLLTFSRKTEVKPRPLNLNRRIEQLHKMLSRTIPRMIEIELILAEDLAAINCDPTQMEQILMNLTVNARDAMPEGGKLIIQTENVTLDEHYCNTHLEAKPGPYVVLSVSDTGQGMDKETVQHIFEPFFTTKGPSEGTGLGLAMVYGIVKQHGGRIMCYSEPSQGTVFKMYFPALVSDGELRDTATRALPRGGSETVLIVDDEELIRDLGARILTRAGYTVITASNGQEALEMYRENRNEISLVIVDLIMPEMGGKGCLEGLLKIHPGAKVLIASGYTLHDSTKETVDMGASGFVNKPYDVRQLLETVRTVLDS